MEQQHTQTKSYLESKYDFSYRRNGDTIKDLIKLKKNSKRMNERYTERFNEICSYIQSNIINNYNGIKKYVIKNKYMFNELKKYIDNLNLNIECSYCEDNNIYKHVVNFIEPSINSGCCSSCDLNLEYYKNKKNVEYIKIVFKQ